MPRKTLFKVNTKTHPRREVHFQRYDDIIVKDDEDEDDDTEETWTFEYADDFPELEDLNDLEEFLEEFEGAYDEDKYTEPT